MNELMQWLVVIPIGVVAGLVVFAIFLAVLVFIRDMLDILVRGG